MKRSLVHGSKASPDRTSSSAAIGKVSDEVTKCVKTRAAKLSNLPVENIEPIQVVWYKSGQQYKPHHDYYTNNIPASGQRLVTIFAYLNDVNPDKGGHTSFPELNLNVPAVKNNAVFWLNVANGKEDPRTLHGGSPVKGGEKFGLNIWILNKKYIN